jgi:hypothetical protein
VDAAGHPVPVRAILRLGALPTFVQLFSSVLSLLVLCACGARTPLSSEAVACARDRLDKPFRDVVKALKKWDLKPTPRAMRRTFQDLARRA